MFTWRNPKCALASSSLNPWISVNACPTSTRWQRNAQQQQICLQISALVSCHASFLGLFRAIRAFFFGCGRNLFNGGLYLWSRPLLRRRRRSTSGGWYRPQYCTPLGLHTVRQQKGTIRVLRGRPTNGGRASSDPKRWRNRFGAANSWGRAVDPSDLVRPACLSPQDTPDGDSLCLLARWRGWHVLDWSGRDRHR